MNKQSQSKNWIEYILLKIQEGKKSGGKNRSKISKQAQRVENIGAFSDI